MRSSLAIVVNDNVRISNSRVVLTLSNTPWRSAAVISAWVCSALEGFVADHVVFNVFQHQGRAALERGGNHQDIHASVDDWPMLS